MGEGGTQYSSIAVARRKGGERKAGKGNGKSSWDFQMSFVRFVWIHENRCARGLMKGGGRKKQRIGMRPMTEWEKWADYKTKWAYAVKVKGVLATGATVVLFV